MQKTLSAFLSSRLLDRRGGHRAAVLKKFKANREFDRLEQGASEVASNERLAELLNHARLHVPWFMRRIKKEATSANARAILADLPVLEREDIQSDPRALLADNAGELKSDATGGSTGTPMEFKVDVQAQVAREASLMWADSLSGWEVGEKIAMLWGSDRDVSNAMHDARASARWWIENRRWYNAFDMGESNMRRYHEEMSAFRPDILVAYAGSLHIFARFLQSNELKPAYPSKALISSAEMITPTMREEVECVFGKAVFDRYGNREAGAIAAECSEHGGLHVNESDFVVEIASKDPARQPGPVLITYLRNYGQPFIRYNTGDLASIAAVGPCACGRNTLRLSPIVGRQGDTIRTAEGDLIHGEFFTHLLYGAEGVQKFQFVQESTTNYVLRVVAEREKVRHKEESWTQGILGVVGAGSHLVIEYVDDIPPLPSGKHKFTISNVS